MSEGIFGCLSFQYGDLISLISVRPFIYLSLYSMLNMVSSFGIFFHMQSYADAAKATMRANFPTIKFESQNMHSGNTMIPLRIDTNGERSDCPAPNFERRESDNDTITSMFQGEISGPVIKASDSLFVTGNDLTCQKVAGTDTFTQCNLLVNPAQPTGFQDTSLCNKTLVGSIELGKKMDNFNTFRNEFPEQNNIHPADHICKNNACKDPINESKNEDEDLQAESGSKKGMVGSGTEQEKEDVSLKGNLALGGEELKNGVEPNNHVPLLNLDTAETVRSIGTSTPKQLLKSSCVLKEGEKKDLRPKLQVLTESLACNISDKAPKNVDQRKNDQKFIVKRKQKQSRKQNIAETASMNPKVSSFYC